MKGLVFAVAGAAVAMGVTLFFEKGIKKGCQKAAESEKTSTVAKRLLK